VKMTGTVFPYGFKKSPSGNVGLRRSPKYMRTNRFPKMRNRRTAPPPMRTDDSCEGIMRTWKITWRIWYVRFFIKIMFGKARTPEKNHPSPYLSNHRKVYYMKNILEDKVKSVTS